jgi:diguanylate cyclase (GGDEF)-like protein/PAS domain S-box-containing protein
MAHEQNCLHANLRSGTVNPAWAVQGGSTKQPETSSLSQNLFCKFSLDGTLTFVNPTYASYFQKPAESLVGANILELVPAEARANIAQQLQDLAHLTPEQPALTQEHEVLTPDGSIRWHQWTNLALFDDQGNITEFQAIGHDITEQKTIEDALKETNQLLNLFFSQSLDGFFFATFDEPIAWTTTTDKETLLDYAWHHLRLTRANQAFLDQYLATEQDMVGWTPQQFFAHDTQLGRQTLRQLFDNGHLHIETHERRMDGTPIRVEGYYICLYDDQQRITGHFGVQRDITDITAAIKALADSETKYRLLVENQTDVVIKLDAHRRVLFASPSYCELFGQSSTELLGQTFMPLVHEDDRATTDAAMAQLLTPPHTCYVEQQTMTVHGWRWLAWSDQAMLTPQGEVEAIVCVGRDITERKLAELALQESEERFRIAMNAAQVGTWDWNIQTGEIVWSETLETLMGLAPGSFDKSLEAVQSMIYPDDRERVMAAIMAAVDTGTDYCIEFRFVRPDGSVRWSLSQGDVIRDEAGKPLRMTGVDIDITERKHTELKLKESEARFRNVTTNLPGAVFRYRLGADGKDHITLMNQGCLDIWEITYDQVIESPALLWDMVHDEDREATWSLVQQSAETLTPWLCEWRITTASGRVKWLQGMGRPERQPDGGVIWDTLILDVSDRKNAERALTHTSRQLQSFMDNTPAMVALFSADGKYLKVNRAGAALFGLTPEDMANKPFTDFLPADIVATFMARTANLIANQTPMVVEDHFRIEGQSKVLQSILFPVTVEANAPIVLGSIATDVTPLVEAQHTLRRQAEEERLMRTMTQHIRQSLEVHQILQTTVNEIREFLETDRVLVYRFHADWSGDIFVESVVAPWNSVLGSVVKDPCFEGDLVQKYLEGRIGQIDDIDQADMAQCHKDLLLQFQVQATLTIPISCNGKLWGLLCVHHCQSPRYWQESEIRLLRQLADQVAIALTQSQLLSQSKATAAQEKLLNNIVTAISGSLELNDILQRVANEMLNTFQASRSLVILCQPSDGVLEHTTTAAVANVDALQGAQMPIRGNPHAQLVLSQTDPVMVNDVTRDPLLAPMRELAQQMHIGAILAVSIRYQDQVKGILSVHQCHGPRYWSIDDQKLIKRVADHLAIAIQQAELYQHAQTELTERKRLESQLRYEAFHDRLTALPNRAFFLEQLSAVLDDLHQNCPEVSRQTCHLFTLADNVVCCPQQFAVLFLDLDRFKIVNDSLGHTIGDTLLQIVAKRLQNCLDPARHMAARLGGDEFVVLLTGLSNVSEATDLALTIHNALEAPILLQQHEVFVRASIGIALSSPEYVDPSQLLRDADIAMYQAKDGNREYAIFDAPMHTLAVQQMQLENDLRHAIDRQEFELYYQPVVNLTDGRLQGFEALIRWRHPQRGLVSPADFIPVAENTGLIADIDLWTLNQACSQMYEWHQQFPQHRELTVNVNLSGKQFMRSDLIQKIDQALANTGLPGKYLKLEITESVLIQNATLAITILAQLKNRNITVCMDDFGTGYSSLSYLHRFPVDVLKIDKSFISGLQSQDSQSGDAVIVRAIISLATSLNLAVVAEGIETPEQLNYLKANHCQGGQGYYYSKPMPAAKVVAYLAEHP